MRQPAKPVFAFSKLLAALCTALFSASVLASQPFVIRDIRVEGVQRTEAGTVFSYLPVKVGESMDDEKAAASLKALYATGFYTDVRLEVENDVLVVFVAERPAIAQIDINGAKEFTKENLKDGLKQVGISEQKFSTARYSIVRKRKSSASTPARFLGHCKTHRHAAERNRVSWPSTREGEVQDRRLNIGASAFSESTLLKELNSAPVAGSAGSPRKTSIQSRNFRATWKS
jgi:outer membrane protein insertion porin family